MSTRIQEPSRGTWDIQGVRDGEKVLLELSHPAIEKKAPVRLAMDRGLLDEEARQRSAEELSHPRVELVTFVWKLEVKDASGALQQLVLGRIFTPKTPPSWPSLEKVRHELEQRLSSVPPDVERARTTAKRVIGELMCAPSVASVLTDGFLLAFAVDTVRACSCVHCAERAQGPVRYVYLVPRFDQGPELSSREQRIVEKMLLAIEEIPGHLFSRARNEPRCTHAAVCRAINSVLIKVAAPLQTDNEESYALAVHTYLAPNPPEVWDLEPIVWATTARTGLPFELVARTAHEMLPDLAAGYLGPWDGDSFRAYAEAGLRKRLLNSLPRFRTRAPVSVFRAVIAYVLELGGHHDLLDCTRSTDSLDADAHGLLRDLLFAAFEHALFPEHYTPGSKGVPRANMIPPHLRQQIEAVAQADAAAFRAQYLLHKGRALTVEVYEGEYRFFHGEDRLPDELFARCSDELIEEFTRVVTAAHVGRRTALLRAIRIELEVCNGLAKGDARKSTDIDEKVWRAARDLAAFLCTDDDAWLSRSQIGSFFGDDLFDRPVHRRKQVKDADEERKANAGSISPGVGRKVDWCSPDGAYLFTVALFHGHLLDEMCQEIGIAQDLIEQIIWSDEPRWQWLDDLDSDTLARFRCYCEPLHDQRLSRRELCEVLVDNAIRLFPFSVRGLKNRELLLRQALRIVERGIHHQKRPPPPSAASESGRDSGLEEARRGRAPYDRLGKKQRLDLARILGRKYTRDRDPLMFPDDLPE